MEWKKAVELFTQHPKATGETYKEHLWFTVTMSTRIITCGLCILIHGVFPFFFTTTTSRQLEKIYGILKKRIPLAKQADPSVDIGAGI